MQANYFATDYSQKRNSLGFVTKIMSLGKFHNHPKHAAWFGSIAKLVKACKRNKIV